MRAFQRGGLTFDVRDEGPADGLPVVLLHGFPQDSTAWDGVAARLHAAGYRTLAPDQRGYSPRARPSGAGAYVQAEVVADAVALLDEAELEQAHIVGHDWGGAVAWGLASAHPGRVRTLTSLSTPHPGAMRDAFLRSRQVLQSYYMGLFQVPGLGEKLLEPDGRMFQLLERGLPPEKKVHYADRMRSRDARVGALNWYRGMARDMVRPSLRLHRITVPTLYIWGARDPALSRHAAEATRNFVKGDYEFVVMERMGHWLPERAPDEVSDALLSHFARTGAV